MTNEVATTKGGALAPHGASANPYADAADDLGASGGLFMKFNGNTGDFTFGAEGEEIPHGSKLIALMDGFARGWICWKEGEVVDEIMVPVLQGKPPLESSLEDHGPYEKHSDGTEDGWTEQAKLTFRSAASGEDYTYKTSSKSGLRALGNLSKDYGRQFRNHPDEVPLVEFGATSFVPKDNKKIGKKWAPIFKVAGWMDAAEAQALADAAGETGEDDPDNYEGGDAGTAEADPVQETAPDTAPVQETQPRRTVAPQQAPAQQPAQETAPPAGRRAKRF